LPTGVISGGMNMKKEWFNNEKHNHNRDSHYNEQKQQTHEEEEFENIDTGEEELEAMRRELEEEKQRHLRTRADFENFRRRMEREIETKQIHARKEILLDLITFLEYFREAKKQVKDPAAVEGIEIIGRQFEELLHKHGVRQVECLGQPFDPEEQEGIGYIETEGYEEGCVCEEISPGYIFGDILLKPARVMVARKPGGNKNEGEN